MVWKHTRAAVTCIGLGLLLSDGLVTVRSAAAGILDATWTAPTSNSDGSALTNLASYRVYYGTSPSPCPGSSSSSVASPVTSPGPNQSMSFRLQGLATGTLYYVSVAAVNANGTQSACSNVASAVARSDFGVSPTGSVNFGSVTLGSSAEQVFTVSNTAGGTISGGAVAAAPFSIVSGSPFTLTGAGATQTVRVRFTPVTTTTTSTNLTFTANGGSLSRTVTGTGTGTGSGGDTTPPTVAVVAPAALATVSGAVTVSASATDNVGVAGVQFRLDGVNLGTEIMTPPYSMTWNSTTAADGARVLTAVARDAAGNVRTSTGVTVTVANAGTPSTVGPVISNVAVSPRSYRAYITWTTDKSSDTQVEYGRWTSYGRWTTGDSTLVTSHSQTITGLYPGTWYHFRVRSRDAAGNLTVSKDFTFKTQW